MSKKSKKSKKIENKRTVSVWRRSRIPDLETAVIIECVRVVRCGLDCC